jgi:4-amino-4-deoxy-L-arabinose transferase-like glycosyltransferase
MRKVWVGAVLVAVLGVGLGLRLHGYASDPPAAANFDGVGWAWDGQALWLHHTTAGWSYLPSYQNVTAVAVEHTGILLPGVSPYFDHPPLFGLLVGGAAVVAGERSPDQVTEAVIRLVPVGLSLLTIVLSYALVRRLTGRQWIGLLAAAALALSPAMVLTARLVESEALLTPLLLAALILALRVRDGAGGWSVIGLLAVCVAAPLVKEPGIVVGVIAAAILLLSRRRRVALLPLGGMAAGVAVYLLFAAAIDWNLFTATVLAQGARRSSLWLAFGNFFTATTADLGGRAPFLDPVWFVGWPVLIGLAVWRREWRPVALAALLYAATIILLGDGRIMKWNGWYRIPDEPLLYAAVVAAPCLLLRSVWARVAQRYRDASTAPEYASGTVSA